MSASSGSAATFRYACGSSLIGPGSGNSTMINVTSVPPMRARHFAPRQPHPCEYPETRALQRGDNTPDVTRPAALGANRSCPRAAAANFVRDACVVSVRPNNSAPAA
jgi:hypothetical protein